jgi:hypothetical protein
MKIKHFIVTYKNSDLLDRCIRSILATSAGAHEREIHVLNNNSDFTLADDLMDKVNVIHNSGRPDFSTGHLSRSWNQALIHGFVSLTAPQADLVICCKNDTIFEPNYLNILVAGHNSYDIITNGCGDDMVSYTAAGVRQVGLWDERFCNIGYQEADYFLRIAKYLGTRGSINDVEHGRVRNQLAQTAVTSIFVRPGSTGYLRRDPSHLASMAHHAQSRMIFFKKWNLSDPQQWGDISHAAEQIDSYILYPYFEKDILTLREQRFITV